MSSIFLFLNSVIFTKTSPSSPRKNKSNALLSWQNSAVDLGQIEQNTVKEDTITVTNNGSDTLSISSIKTSCGCTAALIDKTQIPPRDSAHLKIAFNAKGKFPGHFEKIISFYSNSRDSDVKTLLIEGKVVMGNSPHDDVMTVSGVFSGNCATCHADQGANKNGAELFAADCSLCHGKRKDHRPGIDLMSTRFLHHSDKSLEKIISSGLRNTNMPAFSQEYGGPLSSNQIESLVKYITDIKDSIMRNRVKFYSHF